ncbi:MAG TPA: sigma-70 family RNA polymerase sigma factor [Thermoanaerobaculia bacterium]|jgi:RNA polymerase sigma-70 factor (ECF subfamily)
MELFVFDDDYVRRLREGDRDTALHFHAYFRDLLLLKLRNRLRSMDAIDEVRQEVFLRSLERLDRLKDPSRLGAFVNSICENVLKEYYRAENRNEALDEQQDIADDRNVDVEYDSARNVARVRRVLADMQGREAEILRALFVEELDKDELCRRFDIDRDYLRVLVHRAKEKFRLRYLRRKSGRMSIFETFGDPPSLSNRE